MAEPTVKWLLRGDMKGALARQLMVSLAIHLGLIALGVRSASFRAPAVPPLSVDLTFNAPFPPAHRAGGENKHADAVSRRLLSAPAGSAPGRRQRENPQMQPAPAASAAAPAEALFPPEPLSTGSPRGVGTQSASRRESSPVVAGGAPADAAASGVGQYGYIRDLITRQLVYPPVARRLGWSGRVLLEFVLLEDGGIRTVRIRESSGYQLLDEAAVEAVQRCVPFPRQPAATEIIVPIRFTLSR